MLLHQIYELYKIIFLDAKFYRFLGWVTETELNEFVNFIKIHRGNIELITQYSSLTSQISIILICLLSTLHLISMIGIIKDKGWGYLLGASTVYLHLFPDTSWSNALGYCCNPNYVPFFNLFSDSMGLKFFGLNHFLPHYSQGTMKQIMALCWQLLHKLYNWLLLGLLITHKRTHVIEVTYNTDQRLKKLRQFLIAMFTLTTFNVIQHYINLTGTWFIIIYNLLTITITLGIIGSKKWAYKSFCFTITFAIITLVVKSIVLFIQSIRYTHISFGLIYDQVFWTFGSLILLFLCLSFFSVIGMFKHKRWGYMIASITVFLGCPYIHYGRIHEQPVVTLTSYLPFFPQSLRVHDSVIFLAPISNAIIILILGYCMMTDRAHVPISTRREGVSNNKVLKQSIIVIATVLIIVQLLYFSFSRLIYKKL